MTTLSFKAKYRAHGATEILNLIDIFANSKDVEVDKGRQGKGGNVDKKDIIV
jgi:hypothetical protein